MMLQSSGVSCTLIFWKEKKGGGKSTESDPADVSTFLKVESFASLKSVLKGYCYASTYICLRVRACVCYMTLMYDMLQKLEQTFLYTSDVWIKYMGDDETSKK